MTNSEIFLNLIKNNQANTWIIYQILGTGCLMKESDQIDREKELKQRLLLLLKEWQQFELDFRDFLSAEIHAREGAKNG